ncbi:hypothetical protein TRV_07674 [Trichophyton verrucosum HKI 0517]|uniref:Uncharacterized protein n=1 Tax=Trichophyton verrucosum (strain HKI 0517) TaxID=663202 RepID=D4DKF2_TRIVH|nr:uncharacterized protein TRV_07674 [Trichophyton verrucosum HKI 0517]EFE37684.1 hypothetical protein TRV_07674 [Trichophyton verrucosum HKI 0517]
MAVQTRLAAGRESTLMSVELEHSPAQRRRRGDAAFNVSEDAKEDSSMTLRPLLSRIHVSSPSDDVSSIRDHCLEVPPLRRTDKKKEDEKKAKGNDGDDEKEEEEIRDSLNNVDMRTAEEEEEEGRPDKTRIITNSNNKEKKGDAGRSTRPSRRAFIRRPPMPRQRQPFLSLFLFLFFFFFSSTTTTTTTTTATRR